jgi:nitroimidazol reductase NimA-like FMN-containing flavoprotein (pyridoxamine 5'-phosphate oxidase superfamily)
MRDPGDLDVLARGIIDDNRYMVIGTADEAGRPWVTPVYFAPDGYRTLYWLSSPERQHSRNVAARPEVSIVIFNSQVPIGQGQAVYMTATAAELTGGELERGIEIFSRVSQSHGAKAWSLEDAGAAGLRLYRAVVSEHWVLDPEERPDRRTPVNP